MINLLGYDFKNQLSVDYSSSNSCELNGCFEEGICRCTEIYDCKVKNVDVTKIADIIYNSYFDRSLSSKRNIKINELLHGVNEEINRYTIDRILRINKIWLSDSWEIQTINGYYGEEIDDVILKHKLATEIKNQIEQALDILDINSRVEFLIELEYGQLLTHLQNLSWKIIRLKKDDIYFPSQSHLELVKKKELNYYFAPKYNSIRAIVIKDGDKWKLIDGYHRLTAIHMGNFLVLSGVKKSNL